MQMNNTISNLHFITHPMDGFSPVEQVESVVVGGCDWVQLRMKKHSEEQIIAEAMKINVLKSQADFKLIINDNPEIALEVRADGVHLGKQDMSPVEARKILGNKFIIGGTANTIEDILQLVDQNVDYIGLGPFRFTSTKENLSPVLGLEGYEMILRELERRNINTPVIGIGGIVFQDIPGLIKSGLQGLAVSSSILKANSIDNETSKWLSEIKKSRLEKQKST